MSREIQRRFTRMVANLIDTQSSTKTWQRCGSAKTCIAIVGTWTRRKENQEVYVVGPAAQIGVTDLELRTTAAPNVPENASAIFRTGSRTAALAAALA